MKAPWERYGEKYSLARLGSALTLVGVVLLGSFLRLDQLRTIPPGLFFDEAANLFDIGSILRGAHPLYFPANNGREPLYFYWASLFARVAGLDVYALRLSSAVVGILTLFVTFACAREAFRLWGDDRVRAEWLATAATAVLATTYMHVHFSRWGLRTITLPFFLALSFAFLFRGLRTRSRWAFVAAGLAGGLSIYTYLSSRVAPALLAIPPLAGGRHRFRATLGAMVVVGILWALVAVPLGVYFLRHPQDVQGHTDDVSILNPVNNHGDPLGAVVQGAFVTLGAIDVRGTAQGEQNLPGRPIFDPVQTLFFLLGLGVLIVGSVGVGVEAASTPTRRSASATTTGAARETGAHRRVVAAFLVAWILDQAIPSIFAVNPPGYVRMTAMLPPLAIVAAFGFGGAWDLLRRARVPVGFTRVLFVGAVGVTAALTYRDYLLVWGPSETAYRFMMADKSDSAALLRQMAGSDRVFLAPLYAQDNTIRYLTQGVPLQSFDIGKSLVIPTNRSRGADYVFPASDQAEASTVARELPESVRTTALSDPSGRFPLLIRLSLPAAALPAQPPERAAVFDVGGKDAIALVDARVDPTKARPGGQLGLTLRWLDLQPLPDNYTLFVHLRDARDETVAQIDAQPTGGSYPTTAWQPGDLILDRYALDLPTTAGPGPYRLVVGLYELRTLQRLPARTSSGDAPGAEVSIATLSLPADRP